MKILPWLFVAVLSGLAILPRQSFGQECAYDANSEWPQPVDKVCQRQSFQSGAALLAFDAPANDAPAAAIPQCSSNAADTDGDGWGWENNRSCLVADASGHPRCRDAASDSDGDGWGWEDSASCRVGGVVNKFPECLYRISDADGDGWGYENNKSCRVTAATKYPFCSSSYAGVNNDGWGYENGFSCRVVAFKKQGVIFDLDFSGNDIGPYDGLTLNEDWETPFWHLGFVQGRVDIVADASRGNAMRVTYPANRYGSAGAAAFLSDVEFGLGFPKSYEELYLAYDVKFAAGFDFVRGGKLPGLCGYDNTKSPLSGCNTGGGFPSGYDGFSSRGMWRENGELENYVYHSAQTNFYGDDEYWNVRAQPGTWHRVQHRVVMNTPGQADGILEAWIDGVKVLSKSNFVFRKTANIGINLFYFSTFYGGNDASWAPSQDQYVFFDNFSIATNAEN